MRASRANVAWLTCAAVVCAAGVCQAGPVVLWAIGDAVRIDPLTSRAFEDNAKQLPGGLSGDYRKANAVWSAQERAVSLVAARNEVVACQLVIEGQADRVAVRASALRGPGGAMIPASGVTLYREWYVWIDEKKGNATGKACMAPLGAGWYPDALIPLTEARVGNGFAIPSRDFHTPDGKQFPKQVNQAIWVDVHVPTDAKPGQYVGTMTVDADGTSQTVALKVTVWDFVIPSQMHMHAELMNYGQTVREPTPVMLNYFRLAHEHRVFISDNKAKPAYDGKDYDWAEFDAKFGPIFTGKAFTRGPCAGEPIPYWTFPIEYYVLRPDKQNKRSTRDWPLSPLKTASGYGVQFTEQVQRDLLHAIRKWDEHFVKNGWTRTMHMVFQNSLDEPGFHKNGEGLKAGREQAIAIYETARLVQQAKPRVIEYKLDIGGGNSGNKLDLDGNGKAEGPKDVANYLGPVVPLFSIHGLCIDLAALEPQMREHGVRVVFYNGYHPRVGPNTIHGELLGYRTWAVAAWRSGLAGWADWQFRRETERNVFYEPNDDIGKTLYVYRGDHIGLDGKVFASLRLKAMRRGAQDYEMLRLLAIKDGHDRRAQNIAAMVCGAGFKDVPVNLASFQDDVTGVEKPYTGVDSNAHWSHSPDAWATFHGILGDAIAGKR